MVLYNLCEIGEYELVFKSMIEYLTIIFYPIKVSDAYLQKEIFNLSEYLLEILRISYDEYIKVTDFNNIPFKSYIISVFKILYQALPNYYYLLSLYEINFAAHYSNCFKDIIIQKPEDNDEDEDAEIDVHENSSVWPFVEFDGDKNDLNLKNVLIPLRYHELYSKLTISSFKHKKGKEDKSESSIKEETEVIDKKLKIYYLQAHIRLSLSLYYYNLSPLTLCSIYGSNSGNNNENNNDYFFPLEKNSSSSSSSCLRKSKKLSSSQSFNNSSSSPSSPNNINTHNISNSISNNNDLNSFIDEEDNLYDLNKLLNKIDDPILQSKISFLILYSEFHENVNIISSNSNNNNIANNINNNIKNSEIIDKLEKIIYEIIQIPHLFVVYDCSHLCDMFLRPIIQYYAFILSQVNRINDSIQWYEIIYKITKNNEKNISGSSNNKIMLEICRNIFELANKIKNIKLSYKYCNVLINDKKKLSKISEFVFLTQTICKDYINIGSFQLASNILEDGINYLEEISSFSNINTSNTSTATTPSSSSSILLLLNNNNESVNPLSLSERIVSNNNNNNNTNLNSISILNSNNNNSVTTTNGIKENKRVSDKIYSIDISNNNNNNNTLNITTSNHIHIHRRNNSKNGFNFNGLISPKVSELSNSSNNNNNNNSTSSSVHHSRAGSQIERIISPSVYIYDLSLQLSYVYQYLGRYEDSLYLINKIKSIKHNSNKERIIDLLILRACLKLNKYDLIDKIIEKNKIMKESSIVQLSRSLFCNYDYCDEIESVQLLSQYFIYKLNYKKSLEIIENNYKENKSPIQIYYYYLNLTNVYYIIFTHSIIIKYYKLYNLKIKFNIMIFIQRQ